MHSIIDMIKGGAPTVDVDVKESDVFYFAGSPIRSKYIGELDEYTPVHKSKEDLLEYWGGSPPKTLQIYKVQGFQQGDLLKPKTLGNGIYVKPTGSLRQLNISKIDNVLTVEPVATAWPKAPAAVAPPFKAPPKEQKEDAPLLGVEQRSDSNNRQKTSRLCC